MDFFRNRPVYSCVNSEPYEALSVDDLLKDKDDVFSGLGCLPGEYHIEVDPSVQPVQHAPRRVPVPLKEFASEVASFHTQTVAEDVRKIIEIQPSFEVSFRITDVHQTC